MNAKKFLIIALLFGILRICHAAPMPIMANNNFQLPPSKSSAVSISPYANTSSLAETVQGGIRVKLVF